MDDKEKQQTESGIDLSHLEVTDLQNIFHDVHEKHFEDSEHQSEMNLYDYEDGTITYYFAKFRIWTKPKPFLLRILIWFTAIFLACAAIAAIIALLAVALYIIVGIIGLLIILVIMAAFSKKK